MKRRHFWTGEHKAEAACLSIPCPSFVAEEAEGFDAVTKLRRRANEHAKLNGHTVIVRNSRADYYEGQPISPLLH